MSKKKLQAALLNELMREPGMIIFFADSQKVFGVSAQELGEAAWELQQQDLVHLYKYHATGLDPVREKGMFRRTESSYDRELERSFTREQLYSYVTLI